MVAGTSSTVEKFSGGIGARPGLSRGFGAKMPYPAGKSAGICQLRGAEFPGSARVPGGRRNN